jgi:hypothetical protein
MRKLTIEDLTIEGSGKRRWLLEHESRVSITDNGDGTAMVRVWAPSGDPAVIDVFDADIAPKYDPDRHCPCEPGDNWPECSTHGWYAR